MFLFISTQGKQAIEASFSSVDNLNESDRKPVEQAIITKENISTVLETPPIVTTSYPKPAVPAPSVPPIRIVSEVVEKPIKTLSITPPPQITPRTLPSTTSINAVVLEKKSLDKFLKLASYNSASLLDLNQKSEASTSTSNTKNISKKTASTYNLVYEANPNKYFTIQPRQPPIQVKPRAHKAEKDIEAAILAAVSKSDNSATFRVPSSRHFCGRLLSNKLSSSTSSSSYENSSETSSEVSTASSSALTSNQHNSKTLSSDESDEDLRKYELPNRESNKNLIKALKVNTECQVRSPQLAAVISSSSVSTSSSSTSPESRPTPKMPLSSHNLNLINKPMPTQRRSVSSSNEQHKLPARNGVRFIDNNQENQLAKSQHNISTEPNHPQKMSLSTENFLDSPPPPQPQQQGMKKSHTIHDTNRLSFNSKTMSLAKSVDHLVAATQANPAQQLCKQIDLQSQRDISNIIASNSKTMTLSKSIKDLKLFVSNSYSPSLIVPPPPATNQVCQIKLYIFIS